MDYLEKSAEAEYTPKDTLVTLLMLTNNLSVVKPNTGRQHDIIEQIIAIIPQAGKTSPIQTLELLGKALVWVGADYVTPFARAILILEKHAIAENPTRTFAALEHTLMVCYCKMLTKTFYGTGKIHQHCIEWQRQFFITIVNTVESKPFIDPFILAGTLRLSDMVTGMNEKLDDINQRIKQVSHRLSSV